MPRFLATSALNASRYINTRPHLFIQIAEPPLPVPQRRWPTLRPEGLVASLRLSFLDAVYPSLDRSYFGTRHARRILRFVHTHEDLVDTVCVHCVHGLNRSPAVAAALDFLYSGYESQRKWIERGFNPWIYAVMVREGLVIRSREP